MLFNDNIVEESISRQPKFDDSYVEDPNKERVRRNISHLVACNQSTDSNQYECESQSYESCELEVDVVHTYVKQINIVDESLIGFDELGSQIALVDHVGAPRFNPMLDPFGYFLMEYDSLVTRDNSFHINNLEASSFLSLIHPDLIS